MALFRRTVVKWGNVRKVVDALISDECYAACPVCGDDCDLYMDEGGETTISCHSRCDAAEHIEQMQEEHEKEKEEQNDEIERLAVLLAEAQDRIEELEDELQDIREDK